LNMILTYYIDTKCRDDILSLLHYPPRLLAMISVILRTKHQKPTT
jgi:hypothetical protein